MANHCPNVQQAKDQQNGKLFCSIAGRKVKIQNGVCVHDSCSAKRK